MAKIAVIETGGKQYVVTNDSVLRIEKLSDESGPKVTFDKVLLIDDGAEIEVGAPYITGAKVSGEIIAEGRAKKVTVLRYRQKSRWKKVKGHRQPYATVRITALP